MIQIDIKEKKLILKTRIDIRKCQQYSDYSETKLGANNNEGKTTLRAPINYQANSIKQIVSVAFSYLHQCRVKTGGR